ncbi:hypothetical protein T07_12064 [Trichinella nelsoni]|uniref:Uncharacterized protein n=1 Tax=Trichinella nelsoni TaxID=6336 RepID=A0A0V0RCD4_9BILA|nr:hypothetical protein T07_12064 [Trichinella nelsoni]
MGGTVECRLLDTDFHVLCFLAFFFCKIASAILGALICLD